MTESDWDRSEDPGALLEFLYANGKLSDRKGRLFSVACCDRLWSYLEEPSRRAVRVIERFADGQATEAERAAAEAESLPVSGRLSAAIPRGLEQFPPEAFAAAAVLNLTASTEEEAIWMRCGQFIAQQVVMHAVNAELLAFGDQEMEWIRLLRHDPPRVAICHLIRDIFANPFREPTLAETWLVPQVTSLARSIYATKSFDRMGELADALQSAGCDNGEILAHGHASALHVRGCWLLDLSLGKQ